MKVEPGDLADRLRVCGLPPSMHVVGHRNLWVLVTLTARGVLRVHEGYSHAPDDVIAAIATWARPRVPRRLRVLAGRRFAAFPVHLHCPSPQRARQRPAERAEPEDVARLERLSRLHEACNQRWFDGTLQPVVLRLSGRMRRRLGEFRPAEAGALAEIAISRRHLRRHGWQAVIETLLHEMVHQWQAETGRRLGHDRAFRRKCAEVGIEGGAVCDLASMFLRSRHAPGELHVRLA